MKRWVCTRFMLFAAAVLALLMVIQPDPVTAQEGRVRVLVEFNAEQTRMGETRLDLARAVGAEMLSDSANWRIPFVALEVDRAGLSALRADPRVRAIQQDGAYVPDLESSAPVIGADAVWAQGITGAGWAVAVLDTGVEASHPFFGGRVVAEACFSGSGFADSLCPSGASVEIGAGAASPAACVGYGGCAHGTHVAGIAVGQSGARSGVARGANLIGIQVFSAIGTLTAYDSDIISGLNHVYNLRASFSIAAANLSLSDGVFRNHHCDEEKAALKAAVDLLRSVGIMTTISTGNQGYSAGVTAPACISSALAVGATNDFDQIAAFSNRSPLMDFFAPGVAITSSVTNGGYGTANGTSMAAPHAAGALALLRQGAPVQPADRVVSALRFTGHPVVIDGARIPRIDVPAALAALESGVVANWLENGAFAAGFSSWYAWDGAVTRMPGQWLEVYRQPGSASAVVAQLAGVALPAGTGLAAQVDLGNMSGVRKRAALVLHSSDWVDLAVCSFWLEPYALPRTFHMQTMAQVDWGAAQFSLYLSPDDGIGWMRVDNAQMRPLLDGTPAATVCTDPNVQ